MFRPISLALFLLMVVEQLCAQRDQPRPNRFIATDYNECSMGIKDSSGKWVVKPQYIMIYVLYNGDFEITDFDKHGIIDADGTVIIPMQYDRVVASFYCSNSFYTVELKNRYGVIGRNGKVIVPCYYREVTGNSDSTFSARTSFRQWYIFHRDGSRFKTPWKSWWCPQELDSGVYKAERERWFLRNKFGLFDDSGHVLLRRKYFEINAMVYPHTMVVASRKKRGYFSTNLDTLWPMVFDRSRSGYFYRTHGYYSWFYRYVTPDGVVQEIKNGKIGLINMKGDTLLPFAYDYARLIESLKGRSIWEITRGEESGIFDTGAGWIIPISITDLNTITDYYRDTDSSYVGLFTGRKNDKLGLETTTGEVIVPFAYESYTLRGSTYYFISPDSVQVLTFSNQETRHRLMMGSDTIPVFANRYSSDYFYDGFYDRNLPAGTIPDSGHFNITTKAPGWKLYYHPGHMNDTLRHTLTNAPVPLDKNKISDFPNEQLNACAFEIRTLKPLRTLPGDVGIYYQYTSLDFSAQPDTERFLIETIVEDSFTFYRVDHVEHTIADKQHQYFWSDDGLLLRDDDKILSDREYYRCSMHQRIPDSTVYFVLGGYRTTTIIDGEGKQILSPQKNVEAGNFNTKYTWVNSRPHKRRDHWRLLDNTTNKVVYDDGRSWGGYNVIAGEMMIDYTSKSGWYLYNIAQKKIIAKGFDDIEPLDIDGETFMVRSCTGMYGVINKDGSFRVDTAWNYFTPCFFYGGMTYSGWWPGAGVEDAHYRYIVLYNNTSSIVYNILTGTTSGDKQTLVDSALVVVEQVTSRQTAIYGNEDRIQSGTIRIYTDPATNSQLLPWHFKVIFDSVFARKRLEYFSTEYEDDYTAFTSCHYCGKKTKRYYYPCPNYYSQSNLYEVHFASANVISMNGFNDYGTKRWYTNCVMTDSVVQPVTLQWLFNPDLDWRNYLINAVITYVNTHLNVEGDCHNPAGLPMLLNENFLISEKGIELYPEGFYENDEQLMIVLPWQECSPYLTPGMRALMPIPGNN